MTPKNIWAIRPPQLDIHTNTYKYIHTSTQTAIAKSPYCFSSQGNNKAVLKPRVWPAFAITYFYNHCNIRPTPLVIHERKWKQWLFRKRSMIPRWPLTPLLLWSHVWLYPRVIFIRIPWKYVKVCGYGDLFFKNLNQRSLTPKCPLIPSLLRSHVWCYPRIIMS